MKIESQVCSLELAKKLKELGFEQESAFYYADDEDGELLLVLNKDGESDPIVAHLGEFEEEDSINVSAYTVAELGEMFPDGFICIHANTVEQHREYDLTEADARAKTLIYLKENNLI